MSLQVLTAIPQAEKQVERISATFPGARVDPRSEAGMDPAVPDWPVLSATAPPVLASLLGGSFLPEQRLRSQFGLELAQIFPSQPGRSLLDAPGSSGP